MTFDFTPTDSGLRIHDQIENVWTDIDAGGRVEPEPASTDAFSVPLDDAVRFDAAEIEFGKGFVARIYDEDLDVRAIIKERGTVDCATTHEVDCSPSGVKAYLRVENTGIAVETDLTTTMTFDTETSVHLGVRSHHERPAAVVSTTSDPGDVMQALSTFGTAMKTFSPERAFPTLRGHPPELVVKSSLQIPEEVTPPETGIEVGVPPDLASVFTAAPLAYYLGATVVEDTEPVIAAAGERFPIDTPDLARGVKRTLQHCFTLDCLVRTAGLYPVELRELDHAREQVDIDTETLYDLPLDERTAAYLSFPFEVFETMLQWPTATDVTPRIRNAELLPYLCYRLSVIRSPPSARDSSTNAAVTSVPGERSPDGIPASETGSPQVVAPEEMGTNHSCWVGDAAPRSGAVPLLDSYVTALDETPRTGEIDVHVVCTDDSMEAEVESIYGRRTDQPIDVTVSTDVSTHELRAVLDSDIDFLHFIGHTTPTGLQCTDGVLDLRSLPSGRYPAFFLNGCQSYNQGWALARKGSVGGLVSLEPIENNAAIPAGRLIANLLAFGCTFSQTLEGLQRWSNLEYTAIGDGDYRICASEDYTPIIFHLGTASEADESIAASTELLGEVGTELGVLTTPVLIENSDYVIRTEYDTTLPLADIPDILDSHYPFVVDGDLHWTSELDKSELVDLLTETN